MKRYVIRWALTAGIRHLEGAIYRTEEGTEYFDGGRGVFVSITEAFENLADAKAKAREMAAKKSASLRKQADKFDGWEPKVVDE